MALKITWTLVVATLGVLFTLFLLKMGNATGGGGGIVMYGLLAGAAVIFSAAGLALGAREAKLRDAARELDRVRKRLDDEPQQAEMRKLMEELSGNLDRLQDITNSIDEGICVIDGNGRIEYGFNRRFKSMFGDGEYTGKSIMETVFLNMAPDLRREISEFIELCFQNPATSDSMLNEVNPLNRFSYFLFEGGKEQEKIIKSKIVRIKSVEGDVEGIMLILDDITLDAKLDAALEKHERAFQDEMSIMALIYKNDKDMMINFINEANNAVEKVQRKYQEIEQDEQNDAVLRGIQVVVHLVKGEGFSLGFIEIAKSAEEIELFIKSITGGPVTLEHNLSLIALYENLYNKVSKVNAVAHKLFRSARGPGNSPGTR